MIWQVFLTNRNRETYCYLLRHCLGYWAQEAQEGLSQKSSRRIKSTSTENTLLMRTMEKWSYDTRGVGSYPLAKGFVRRNSCWQETEAGSGINYFTAHLTTNAENMMPLCTLHHTSPLVYWYSKHSYPPKCSLFSRVHLLQFLILF